MQQLWIPKCLEWPHTFLGTLFITSTFLDVSNQRPKESKETLVLRGEILRMISSQLGKAETAASDSNIIAVLHMIAGETIGRVDTPSDYHQVGIMQLVACRGGLQNLGLDGQLASMISWLLSESSILREKEPEGVFRDYCSSHSSKAYTATATIPESQLYCPRQTYITLQRSDTCTKEIMSMIEDIRRMIQILLDNVSLIHRVSYSGSTPILTFRHRRGVLIVKLSTNSTMIS